MRIAIIHSLSFLFNRCKIKNNLAKPRALLADESRGMAVKEGSA